MQETEFHLSVWRDSDSYGALVFEKGDGYVGPLYQAWSVYVNILGFGFDLGRVIHHGEPVVHPPRVWGFDWRREHLARYWGYEA